MSDQKMQECFEFFYSLKWDQVNDFEQQAWKAAWMASRECLVIELPKSGIRAGSAYISSCEAAVHAAGVKTK